MSIISTIINPEPLMSDDNALISFVASKIELPEEIVITLFRKFIANAETILTKFEEEDEDAAALKMAVHSLKGISRNLYLEALGNACEAFERALPTLTSDEKRKHLLQLGEETLKIIAQMKRALA